MSANAQLAGDLEFIADHTAHHHLTELRMEWVTERVRLAARRLEAREEITEAMVEAAQRAFNDCDDFQVNKIRAVLEAALKA